MLITMNVNGKKVDIDVSYDEYLVDTLRRIGNLSVKRGCDTGCCGLCSIWIDEKPTLSCSTLSIRADKKNIPNSYFEQLLKGLLFASIHWIRLFKFA